MRARPGPIGPLRDPDYSENKKSPNAGERRNARPFAKKESQSVPGAGLDLVAALRDFFLPARADFGGCCFRLFHPTRKKMNFCGKWSERTAAGVVGTSGVRWFQPRPRLPVYSTLRKSSFFGGRKGTLAPPEK